MCVAYRRLRSKDEAGVLDLSAEVFGDNRQQRRQEWRAVDPGYLERTCVAVAPDGTLVGAASYAVRHRRDTAGRPRRVGHLKYLAIRAAARRQGHGGRLLQETLAALGREGCDWALILPGPEAAGFYARHGWRAFPVQVC